MSKGLGELLLAVGFIGVPMSLFGSVLAFTTKKNGLGVFLLLVSGVCAIVLLMVFADVGRKLNGLGG